MSAITSIDVAELLEVAQQAHNAEVAQTAATAALVHQVALLTEQHRIGNLIALGLGTSSPQIREGLGL